MSGGHDLLKAITVVLCVAAVTTVLFQKLRQPVVLGYILAGVLVGPYVPVPLAADHETIQSLSELGVILLMFALGLEFSLRKLVEVGPAASLTAVVQSSIMLWLGFLVGRAFGWTALESIFAGAIVAISSTTIIAKAFDEQGIRGNLRELVVGVLIVEDLIAILLMAVLTAMSSGAGFSAETLLHSGGRLAAFLIALLSLGMLLVPRAIRAVTRLGRPETTLVASVGICFATALLAYGLGYSVALGAFIAGSLVAESGQEKQIEQLVLPVRDLFAAIFFVSVGMLIDPGTIARHWGATAAFTLLVIVGKVLAVTLGAFLTGYGTRTSIRAGMSMAQIGEFSFIIAGTGLSLGATRDFLYPVTVAVSAITTLTTPWLIRFADPAAALVDRTLPPPLQTFAALYGTWLEELKSARRQTTAGTQTRRLFKWLLIDSALLLGLTVGAALSIPSIVQWSKATLGLSADVARALWIVGAVLLGTPLLVGMVRLSRGLGLALAQVALPLAGQKVDLVAAPRRALVVVLQLAIFLVVYLPVVAVAQPFIPSWITEIGVSLTFLTSAVAFWRSAENLELHVKAGAQAIVEVLVAQAQNRAKDVGQLEQLSLLMHGLGEPVPLRLDPTSAAAGKTLGELNLRGLTGATVLAIAREGHSVVMPTAGEVLRGGDVLAVAGTHEALVAAKELLGVSG